MGKWSISYSLLETRNETTRTGVFRLNQMDYGLTT